MFFSDNKKFDFSLFFGVLLLMGIGLLCIYSATRNAETEAIRRLFSAQILWVGLSLILFTVVVSLPIRFYYGFAYLFYGISLVLLILLEIKGGQVVKGAERWIQIAGFKVQPSEFVKIGLLLALSRYLSAKSISLSRLSSLLIPAALILAPFGLVLKQPDLGTAMIICAMVIPMLFWGGMSVLEIVFLISPALSMILSFHVVPWGIYFLALLLLLYFTRPAMGLAAMTIISNLGIAAVTAIIWNLLHDYQKNRILSFLDPNLDPFGS
jgi:rod shape determining protein RodA